jgi:DNA-binding GntR family transcriptional regulator
VGDTDAAPRALRGPPEPGAPAILAAEGRLLDAVADGTVLRGTAAELAARLGVRAAVVRAALAELAAAGWIVVEADEAGRLVVRLAEP